MKKKIKKYSRELNLLGVHRNMRGCIFEINSEGLGWLVIDSIFVDHFVEPDLRVETFFQKDEAAENGGVDFEIGDIGTTAHLYWRLKKLHGNV